MNKNLLALLGIAPVLSSLHAVADNRPDPRPNIIFFLVDDMGWQDTSLPFWTEKTMYNERTNVTKPLTWSVWPVRE